MEVIKNTENFLQYFERKESFTTKDVYDFFLRKEHEINRATVNWRIYHFIQQGLLKRIGRGIYTLGKANCFSPALHKKQKDIFFQVKKQFPLVNFCCWHSSAIREFFHHLSTYDFLLVEVEREIKDAVFHFVKDINKVSYTFKEPLNEMMENFVLDSKDSIIIKSLISEAPIQKIDGVTVPTIEKILVDLYADSEIFFFVQGNELLNIFTNVLDKYTVNQDRLLRYAKRRNKREELQKLLMQINGKKRK